jgi:cell division septation protein DedD
MKRILLFFSLMVQSFGSQAASTQWYIMLGAFKQENHGETAASNLRNTASKCGFDAKFDYSVTLRGATLGYVVTFIGPFGKRSIAEDLLPSVKTCIPEAYIKQVIPGD